MFKRYLAWPLTGLALTIVPLIVFLYLILINVDCDQFSCIGYFILFVPMFLLGVLILMIAGIAGIVMAISKRSKKNKDESFN